MLAISSTSTSTSPSHVTALTALLALLASGCSGLMDLQAGPTRSVSHHPEHDGVAVNLSAGAGAGDNAGGAGLGYSVRTKFGTSRSQFAVAPHLYMLAGGSDDRVVGYLRGGFALLNFESVDKRGSFGMFGPFAELGFLVHLSGVGGVTASVGHEYNLRFTEGVPNEGCWLFLIGYGAAAAARPSWL